MTLETPSKPLANTLSNMDLSSLTPTSTSKMTTRLKLAAAASDSTVKGSDADADADADNADNADNAEKKQQEKREEKREEQEEEEDVEEYRKKFVGEVDLPEKEEPLLKESTSRFVLFPIKYREVSVVVVLLLFAFCFRKTMRGRVQANADRRFRGSPFFSGFFPFCPFFVVFFHSLFGVFRASRPNSSYTSHLVAPPPPPTLADLANVQESRSLILDSRRDQPRFRRARLGKQAKRQ
jgi:hypothetical protein